MSHGHPALEHERPAGEIALIEAARRDPVAFGPLYALYMERIYSYLWVHATQSDDAADLTQQVFVQALAALPRYRVGEAPFAAWLFRIAHNVAADWRRRRRPTVPLDQLPDTLHPRTDGVDGEVLRREALARLHTLVTALDTETREILILRFTAQLTLAEIGAVLGKSEDAVRKRITRALHRLKEQFHDDAR
jgi:RNA polymerase sigma-70 factor (ECF subfamily)